MKNIRIKTISFLASALITTLFLTGCHDWDGFMGNDSRPSYQPPSHGKVVRKQQSEVVTKQQNKMVKRSAAPQAEAAKPAAKVVTTKNVPLEAPAVKTMSAPSSSN